MHVRGKPNILAVAFLLWYIAATYPSSPISPHLATIVISWMTFTKGTDKCPSHSFHI